MKMNGIWKIMNVNKIIFTAYGLNRNQPPAWRKNKIGEKW